MLAPPFGQPGPGTTDRAAVEALDRFDGGPTDQVVALLGDPSTVDRGVGLTVAGGDPGPGAQLLGPVKAGHVADLGHEHRAQHRPDAGDGLDPRCAADADLSRHTGAFDFTI